MIDFSKSKFTTDYSFASIRGVVRTLSDAFSKEFADPEKAKLYAAQATEGKCMYCGVKLYKLEGSTPVFSNLIHFDHIYPASNLNLFTVGNVALSCETCNLEKSNRDPLEYYEMRLVEDRPTLVDSKEDFVEFLDEFTLPYQEEFPEHYKAGTQEHDDEEIKELAYELLYSKVSFASMRNIYNHESSVNRDVWSKVVDLAYEQYSETGANDVEARIGFTNKVFEDTFGYDTRIETCSLEELNQFFNDLLYMKRESQNEVGKYRRLIKLLVEVLYGNTLDSIQDKLSVPTYGQLHK